jgi:L-serine dehydratase
MEKQPASIFNEVFGPVMTGPSSSHTAGPARIGMMAHQMLSGEVSAIEIVFDRRGSFAAQYQAQGSDFGFVGGILGTDIADESIKRSLIVARDKGIAVDFRIEALEGDLHPNFARISVSLKDGSVRYLEAQSTGGGMFEVIRFEGYPVMMRGDYYEVLITTDREATRDQVQQVVADDSRLFVLSNSRAADGSAGTLVNIKFDQPVAAEVLDELKQKLNGSDLLYLEPVLPVVKQIGAAIPFVTAAQALEYAEKSGSELWELACDYESALSGKSRREVLEMMARIAAIMRDSAHKGIAGNFRQRGFLPPRANEMERNFSGGARTTVDAGLLNKAVIWSTAVMEYDICMGRVVAAPTGGSAGVLPGAIVSIGEDMGKSDEEIARALLVGGLIGAFVDHSATFAAELAACQAENGAASSMAAAGLVQLLGGTVEEGFAAASLALQNMLGLICDPVAGTGNVPCVARNSSAAANAVVSANMVLWGFNPAIPLDEVIETMMSVGKMLPAALRCTGGGGLCQTRTAKKIVAELDLTPVHE